MNFRDITNESLIKINAQYSSKEEAINDLVLLISKSDVLTNKEEYLESVKHRESQGATGVGMGLAIPHGKSKSVKRATVAIATLNKKIKGWESIEEGDEIELVVLLAILETTGSDAYIDLLGALSERLAEDDFRGSILSSKTPK